jgi:hypothetical protein
MADYSGDKIVNCLSALKAERDMHNTIWADPYRYTFPSRGQGFINPGQAQGMQRARTAKDEEAMRLDSTLAESAEMFAAALVSGLTPSNSNWLALDVEEDTAAVIEDTSKEWLQSVSTKIHKRIHMSNYDAEAYDQALDVTIGGMAGILVELNVTKDGFIFEYWPQDTMYCAQTVSRRFIDTVYREVYLTAGQAKDKFTTMPLPEKITREYADKPDSNKQFCFIHCIRPRMRGKKQMNGKYTNTMAYEGVWVEKQTKTVVHTDGYRKFPVIIPRYRRIPGSAYAEGAVATPLADAMTLNQVTEFVLTNAEMMIAGTFVAKPDGRLNENTIVIGPRKVVFAANVENIKPLTKGGDMSIAEWLTNRLERRIRKAMKSDQLEPIEKQGNPVSATEIRVRIELIRALLGPIFARMQAELLHPLVDRCYDLGTEAGWFGPMPDDLVQRKLTPRFLSPMARAAQAEEVQSIQMFEQYLIQAAQLKPEVLDVYDAEKAARRVAEYRGVPQDLIRSEKATKKSREDKQTTQGQQVLGQVIAAQAGGESPAYNVGQ